MATINPENKESLAQIPITYLKLSGITDLCPMKTILSHFFVVDEWPGCLVLLSAWPA